MLINFRRTNTFREGILVKLYLREGFLALHYLSKTTYSLLFFFPLKFNVLEYPFLSSSKLDVLAGFPHTCCN